MATLKEVLQRLYYDLVVRRARVRVVPAAPVALAAPPIFLVGLYRSGTTLLRYVVDSHRRLACPPESDFLGALRPLVEDALCREGLRGLGFDEAHVAQRLREFVAYFFGNYAASRGKPRWADKSPAGVAHLEFVRRLFPEARWVLLYRHGLNLADSVARACAGAGRTIREAVRPFRRPDEDPRLGGLRYWTEQTGRLLDFEAAHPEACLRLRYEDLCAAPEPELRRVFEFLGEAWEPAVLEFWRFPHDLGREDGRTGATRGFVVGPDHYRAWPAALLAEAEALAGPTLARLGYRTAAT